MRRTFTLGLGWLCLIGLVACGGGAESPPEMPPVADEAEATSGAERPAADPSEGMGITGLMGTIRQDEVENTLHPRMRRFMRCFARRMGDVEFLAGDMRMGFRIHTDGRVAWVYPQETTIGDRATEACVLDVARRARFPRPRGGEAEFSWSFGFDAAEDIRPPVNWAASRVQTQIDEATETLQGCDASGTYRITAYVAPGGRVMAAGGSASSHESASALECVLEAVQTWELPSPGSYAAKVTFEVP